MTIYSAIGFIGLTLAEHLHGFDLALLGNIYTSLRILVALWLTMLGVAFYQDKLKVSPT